jgi:HlyD family secretion protein
LKSCPWLLLLAALLSSCGSKDNPLKTETPDAGASRALEDRTIKEGTVAAAGHVEPVSEDIKVGSEIPGRLQEIRVEEGARIKRGQIIAVLDNRDYQARVEEARAELHLRQAELERLNNGSRSEERQEALAATRETDAVVANARAEKERRDRLFQTGDISRADDEEADREFEVAKAKSDEAHQHYSLVDAGPRNDEVTRAKAAIELAQAQLDEAEARLAKTVIRSPVTGIVLRKIRRAGESVTGGPDAPIVTVADDSAIRVRVDVDESDVGRVHEGQRAYVTADTYGDQKFWGHVIRVGKVLGPKNVYTDAPTEHVDTKILETLVELDGHPNLPDGLRVDSYILTGIKEPSK